MESKIMIDINYGSRAPQIVVHYKESDDPRDKLICMLLGESMPGVRDGYCKIERFTDAQRGIAVAVITPIHPIELIDHIPTIAEFAEQNAASDTSGVADRYLKIVENEYKRISSGKLPGTSQATPSPLQAADKWAIENMSPELYKKWTHQIMYPEKPDW